MKGPRRLAEEDAEIARLFAATRTDAPCAAQVEKAMARSRATSIGASPGATPRGRARSWIVTAIVGTAIVASLGVWSNKSSHKVTASPTEKAIEEKGTLGELPTPKAEDVAIAVSDLPSEAPAAPSTLVRPRAAAVKFGSKHESSAQSEPEPSRSGAATAALGSSAAPPSSPSTTKQSTFAEELALVKSARSALARRDVEQCLGDVERYDRTFATGIFAEEIAVIRIEALARSGAPAQARTLAERFLDGHGSSPYASRVRSVLQTTKNVPVSE